jgi:hypothetical protein
MKFNTVLAFVLAAIVALIAGVSLAEEMKSVVSPSKPDSFAKPVAYAGTSTDYLSRMHITMRDEPAGHGPTGTAIRESRYVVCNDISKGPLSALWQETIQLYGNTSVASFPIKNKRPFPSKTMERRSGPCAFIRLKKLFQQ